MADERGALAHRSSFFEHASRLHERAPDLPLPDGGRPYPDQAGHLRCPADSPPLSVCKDALAGALAAFLSGRRSLPELHDDLRDSRVPHWISFAASLRKVPGLTPDRAREIGVWLVRNSTDRTPVAAGLALLARTGRPEDFPLLRTIGLLRLFGPAAVKALKPIPGSATTLVWLAERSTGHERMTAVAALCRLGDPATLPWLLRRALDGRAVEGGLARQVAETVSLAEALEGERVGDEVLVQAGRLLRALCQPCDDSGALSGYADACRAITAFARHAGLAAPTLDLVASVVTLAEAVRTGDAFFLPWAEGERRAVLDRLGRALASPHWTEVVDQARRSPDPRTRWRACWAARAIADTGSPAAAPASYDAVAGPHDAGAGPYNEVAVHVAVPDPLNFSQVQTRLLVDGRPVATEAFRKGPMFDPEHLLATGMLRATATPREVRLAEAHCTEGCCGALYVTIARDGGTVVWDRWRDSGGTVRMEAFRFEARRYADTIARAERDHRWEWPARSVARKLSEHLRADPGVLSRWRCELQTVYAQVDEQDRIRMMFWHPRRPSGGEPDDPWLQFEWIIPLDPGDAADLGEPCDPADAGHPTDATDAGEPAEPGDAPVPGDPDPADRAASLIERLRRTDPRTFSRVVGGSPWHAERLGYPWPSSCTG
ncbi:hypothetical protein [Sphaerisporangium flaviroseum]|uniref:hypothetical protein n=1 Tax=Sphaerisporangium flaviroseum TaxID=509199 RepID=UPI0031F02837